MNKKNNENVKIVLKLLLNIIMITQ